MSAPINDNLANATELIGTEIAIGGTTVGSTIETGGAADDWEFGDGDVWYKWTAPSDGILNFLVTGLGEFTGEIDAFTGTSFDDLVFINWTRFTLTQQILVAEGTTYLFQVDTYDSADFGAFTLNLTLAPLPPPPVNDNFADRIVLSGTSFSNTKNNQGATTQDFEDDTNYASIWYEYTPSVDGTLSLSVSTSDIASRIRVYSGSFLRTLHLVNDNINSSSIAVRAGVAYKIAICALSSDFSDRGNIVLTGTFAPVLPIKFIHTNLGSHAPYFNSKGIVRESGGRIFCHLSSVTNGVNQIAYSTDGGATWTLDSYNGFTNYPSGKEIVLHLDANENLLCLEPVYSSPFVSVGIKMHIRDKNAGTWTTQSISIPNSLTISGDFSGIDSVRDSNGDIHIVYSLYTSGNNDFGSPGINNLKYTKFSSGIFSTPVFLTTYYGTNSNSGSLFTVFSQGFSSLTGCQFRLTVNGTTPYIFWIKMKYIHDDGPWGSPGSLYAGPHTWSICKAQIGLNASHNIDPEAAVDWLTTFDYTAGQYAFHLGSLYYCLVSHTSGIFATDLGAGKWQLATGYSTPSVIASTTISDFSHYYNIIYYDQRYVRYTILCAKYISGLLHLSWGFEIATGHVVGGGGGVIDATSEGASYTIDDQSQGDVANSHISVFSDIASITLIEPCLNGNINVFGNGFGSSDFYVLKRKVNGVWLAVAKFTAVVFGNGAACHRSQIPSGTPDSLLVLGTGN